MNRTDSGPAPVRLLSPFTDHPAGVGESYWEHFRFAMTFSGRLFAAGSAAFVHALVPALFERTASREIAAMHAKCCNRGRKSGA